MNINNLTIFTSSVCNLNCTYCYVKKEKAVFDYDTAVVSSILNNEYINRFKTDFPESVNSLTRLEFWGAEPSIHLDLMAEKLKDFKEAFPNLNQIFMSSNYSLPTFIDKVKLFIDAMANLSNTKWTFHLQCSIDGSEEITDGNRGKGTTQAILLNLNKLKELDMPDNVNLIVCNKATIARESYDDLVNIEFCENYFNFLKNALDYKGKNKDFSFAAPTCVEPMYYTKSDGLKFSQIIENFIILSHKYNYHFVPYVRNRKYKLSEYMKGGLCGQCSSAMVMLPDNTYGVCSRSGFDIIPEHHAVKVKELKNDFDRELISRDAWIKDINGYKQLRYNMTTFYETRTKAMFHELYNTAKVLLAIGEISNEYINDDLLKKHIQLFARFTTCMQTNKELTGSYFCCSSYFLPLFFNGAMTKLYNYAKEKGLLEEGN